MNEQRWINANRPYDMLDRLVNGATERKARLLGVASCRSIYGGILDQIALAAVGVAELFGEGLASVDELAAARSAATLGKAHWEYGPECWVTNPPSPHGVSPGSYTAVGRFRDERVLVCNHIRDIFGNPFRPVTFDSAWRSDTAVSLARHIYESRDFSAIPILADALQDAGCEHADVLTHCRDETLTHVRGCWVVDLVLGKE